jgi:Peptidase A4 family
MSVLQLGNGFSVRTFQAPPEGFDPDEASDRERIVHGIPRCPVAFGALEQRMRTKLKNFSLIEPKFEPREQTKRLPSFRPAIAPQTTNNWCGGIAFPPSGDPLKFVEGTWSMPTDVWPGSLHDVSLDDVWYSASFWIGLDGDDGSSDLLHAGCEVDSMNVSVPTGGAYVTTQFKPFWEWRPAGAFWITNMPVSGGDELTSLICMHQGSTNQATIFLGNLSTKIGLWFQVNAPAGVSLSGNCAEWIVEALAIDTPEPELGVYGSVFFTDCNAGTVSGRSVDLSAGSTITMVDASGTPISQAGIDSPTEVSVSYVYNLVFGRPGS